MYVLWEMESFICMYCIVGKTALLHALASSDGLTVDNTENIQLLLKRGRLRAVKYPSFNRPIVVQTF